MHLIQLHQIAVNHAGKTIFRDLSWAIGDRDRVGLVGPNGAGKSSLMNAIAGILELEKGHISRMSGISVGYLPQNIDLPEGTLWDAVAMPSPNLQAALEAVEATEAHLSDPEVYNDADALEAALDAQQAALMIYEKLEPERQRSLLREILTRLGFTPEDDTLSTASLSGGEKKLAYLARLAAWSPDILLLDEPDNHLDLASKRFLSKFINAYRGAVVMISHDRYLLDEVVTQIAELDEGRLNVYQGTYSSYALEREARRLRQQQAYAVQQREIARVEAMIHEFQLKARADLNERFARQAASRRKMLARMVTDGEMVERVNDRKYMEMQLSAERGSTKAIELKQVSLQFGDVTLFHEINLLIQFGERVGLIGANGVGKSVIFRLIQSELEPTSGMVKVGPSIRIGYYAQEHETLNAFANRTPIDLVRDVQPMPEATAVNKLLKFAFTYEQTRQPIKTFSGGERSRLQLLALMLQQPNLLLLDEPTNNLDIGSAEVLENALDEFNGAILTISHDRYFLDRVVDRIVELENKMLTEYVGNYADYEEQKQRLKEAALRKAEEDARRKVKTHPKKRA